MQRKKVDERVRTLIENGAKTSTRSCFVIVGDRGKDQVANLHYILTKAQLKARPSVLWCYNKELGFSTCVCDSVTAPAACARGRGLTPSPPSQPPAKAHEGDQEDAGKGAIRPRERGPV